MMRNNPTEGLSSPIVTYTGPIVIDPSFQYRVIMVGQGVNGKDKSCFLSGRLLIELIEEKLKTATHI